MPIRIYMHALSAGLLLTIPSAARADVVISSAQTANIACSAGVCSPTAANAVLNVGDLESLLASGAVEVTTTGAAVQANNIKINAPLLWSSTYTLTLDAFQSVWIVKRVTVNGAGGLTVTVNDGGSNGSFSFGPSGGVTFQNLASPLAIDGRAYKLVNSLPTLIAAVLKKPKGAFALANNYDARQDGTYDRPPMHILKGAIEGLGNTISHLSITLRRHPYEVAAPVEKVGEKGVIANLRLSHIRYRNLSRASTSAGLVGTNYGYLFGDEATGTITAPRGLVAGLANYNAPTGTISASSTDVTISTEGGGGGLVYWNNGAIMYSRAAGAVSAGFAGGLVGQNEGAIAQSFASGAVSGGQAGGFASANTSNGIDTGTIVNSYATGKVTGTSGGGFVSDDSSEGPTVATSYSTGSVGAEKGGFVCYDYTYDFSDDYWDTTTSGTTYASCYDSNFSEVTGLTSKQLRSGLPAGFDPSIWAEDRKINNGFPYLIANPPVN